MQLFLVLVCGVCSLASASNETARITCFDRRPPKHWANPTCRKQKENTNNCEKRRSGELDDGICLNTCLACKCEDKRPPKGWANPTCEKQLKNTYNCEKRRSGERKDGYCSKTCGVCTEPGQKQCLSDVYKCASQDEARQRCEELGYRLCAKEEIESQVGQNCAYMWTSSSTTQGFFVSNGDSEGCGVKGELHSNTKSYNGVGNFDAACCRQGRRLSASINSDLSDNSHVEVLV